MEPFTYTGVTAYVRNTPETTDAFRALAEAIPQLKAFTGHHNESLFNYAPVMESEAFTHIRDNSDILSPCQAMLPSMTPAEYRAVKLSSEEINEIHMTRLYIPIAEIGATDVAHLANDCIRPVLMALFGDNLVGIKSKTGTESDEFFELPVTTVLSAKRQPVTN